MRNYTFGARKPTQNADQVATQLRLAVAYQAALVAIERKRRQVVDRLYQHACPAEYAAHVQAETACEAAARAVSLQRARPGDMLEPDEEMKAEARTAMAVAKEALAEARAVAKTARDAWYAARKAATPKLRKRMTWCQNGAYARNKAAYGRGTEIGLAWGTRLKCGEWAERAGKAATDEGTLPHFPRFDGGGTIAVQLQPRSPGAPSGLSIDEAYACADTRFRLEKVSAEKWQAVQGRSHLVGRNGKPLPQPKEGGSRSRRPYALAHLRIGSVGRDPVWAVWPIVISRELPPGRIKWVQAIAHKIGDRLEWQIMLTIDEATSVPLRESGAILAVNLGWRNLRDGGLRVAYAIGSDGHEEEVRVPPEYTAGVAHVDSLRSIRDRLHETAKRALANWCEEHPAPGWLTAEIRYLPQWRTQRHLAMLVVSWRERRFDGDETMFMTLDAWRKKDRHLRFWECDERAKLLRRRKDFYRCVAARWAERYARILITDMDLRDFAELPAPEDGAATSGNAQRRSRMLAAPSELRDAVKNACSTRGASFEPAKGAHKTETCNACAGVLAFPARAELEHTCPLCGARWDQDANHCKNLLASDAVAAKRAQALAPSVSSEKTGGDKKEGRWERRRSQKANKAVGVAG